MNRPSNPPPAQNLVMLAADLVASRANKLLCSIAFGKYEPARQLRQALDAYELARVGDTCAAAQSAEEPAPETKRSEPHMAIDQVPGIDDG